MNIGTKSLLFGAHQFALHPWFVALAWWKLYGFPLDPRLWVAFFVHDLGYWGKPNMDGPEGETHCEFGARVMSFFDCDGATDVAALEPMGRFSLPLDCSYWHDFALYHSRFYAKRDGKPFSRLCVVDKLAISLTPAWLFLPLTNLTGEIHEYMNGRGARSPAEGRTQSEWYAHVQAYCKAWAFEHRDGKCDTWTQIEPKS